MTNEEKLRHDMVRFARSLFDRGFSVGSAGNISAALEDGFLITPTNSCLGHLEHDKISKVDHTWRHVSGEKPSKEAALHRAFYETRPKTGAVVHLHSTHATALSCLADIDPNDCIPPLTPYVIMRVGRVKLLPYVRPGDPAMGEMVRQLAGEFSTVLLANHGPVVSGPDIASAVYAAEELEETAKLAVMLQQHKTRHLAFDQIEELRTVFGKM